MLRERLGALGIIIVLFGGTFVAGYAMGRASMMPTTNAEQSVQIIATRDAIIIQPGTTPTPSASPSPQPTIPTATLTPDPLWTATHTPEIVVHTVQSGDTLSRIADDYNVTIDAIIGANNLPDPNNLQIGQDLIVPLNDVPVPTPTSTLTVTLRPTEALPAVTADPAAPTPAAVGLIERAARLREGPQQLQGIDITRLIVMDAATRRNVQAIYAGGQSMGRNPHAFSKVGDSTIESPHFMNRFDSTDYNLGQFAYLQPTIDHFQGSFAREGYSVRRGLHSWNLFNPAWVAGECLPEEGPVECEIRVNNPAFVIIRLGSNDVGVPRRFEANMRRTVEYAIAQGVVPIIGTKADRHEGDNSNNDILRRIAADYKIPLWDFDLIAATIPGRGLGPDDVHMTTFYDHDWTSPLAWQRGHAVHTLTGLMTLDAVWRVAANDL